MWGMCRKYSSELTESAFVAICPKVSKPTAPLMPTLSQSIDRCQRKFQLLGLEILYSQFWWKQTNHDRCFHSICLDRYISVHGWWIVAGKGASTAKSGSNGITGQVNADLVKPSNRISPYLWMRLPPTEGRAELNVHLNTKGKVSNGLYLHGEYSGKSGIWMEIISNNVTGT